MVKPSLLAHHNHMRIAMKYALPLLMFVALSSFSFSARAANDDLLNATLGQAIGQFMSQAQQPGKATQNAIRPTNRGRILHAKKVKGQQTPALPVVAAPVAPTTPASPAVPASAAAPSTPATFTRPMNSLPAIAPAAGTPVTAPAPTAAQPAIPSSNSRSTSSTSQGAK
ncbi:MAG TPA: hypothetical protein VL625_03585 [Patescibacteria group bacterium]|nr:hypothetical protein [Patescibacteria group bacterium]